MDPYWEKTIEVEGENHEIKLYSYSTKCIAMTSTEDFGKKFSAHFKEIGGRHYSRVDYILSDNSSYFLEINTYPGMTKTSLFPMSSNSIGVNFDNLMIDLIELGLKSD